MATDAEQQKIVDEALDVMKNGSEKARAEVMHAAQRAGQRWLTDEEFNKRFEEGKKIGSQRGDDELMMQFLMFGTHFDAAGEPVHTLSLVMMAGFAPADDKEKQQIMMGLGAKWADTNPDDTLTTVVHISEAWVSLGKKDEPDREHPRVMPRDDPDHTEAIIVHALSMDMRQSFYQGEIIKDADGKFLRLDKKVEMLYDPAKPMGRKQEVMDRITRSVYWGYSLARQGGKGENKDGSIR